MKKISMTLAAAVILAVGSAFKTVEKPVATDWYAPINTTLDPSSAGASNFANYNSTPLDSEPGCDGELYVCAGRFPNTGQPAVEIRTKD